MHNILNKSIMRFKMIIAYDGTDFQGWQSQPNGKAVQDAIEESLRKVFKEPIRLHGASRTDSGVHAQGQVGHFDAQWKYSCKKLQNALQTHLPKTILICSLSKASKDFHARFCAQAKRYIYKIKCAPATPFENRYFWSIRHPIDIKLLKDSLKSFEGRHDFSALAGNVLKEETQQKTLFKCSASIRQKNITIVLIGSGFLYKMARSIVGTAIEVARGKLPLMRLKQIFKSKKRTHEIVTAPACGLYLEKVFYKPFLRKKRKKTDSFAQKPQKISRRPALSNPSKRDKLESL